MAVLLLTAACGGGSSDGDTADGAAEAEVESPDGLAVLSLGPGSLPDGVSPNDVQLDVLVDETAVAGAPMMAVRLSPNGLVLMEPATLTIDLPDALDDGFMAIHISGDSVEFLDGDIVLQEDGELSFEALVGHFSVIELYDANFIEVFFAADPEQVFVGDRQFAFVELTIGTDPVSLWFNFESDPEGTFRLVTFSPTAATPTTSDGRIAWGLTTGRGLWEPHQVRGLSAYSNGIIPPSISAASKCLKPNSLPHYFSSTVSFELTMRSRGDPVTRDIAEFGRSVSESPAPPIPSDVRPGAVDLLDLSPGDTFEAVEFVSELADSRCTEFSSSDASSTGFDTTIPGSAGRIGTGTDSTITTTTMSATTVPPTSTTTTTSVPTTTTTVAAATTTTLASIGFSGGSVSGSISPGAAAIGQSIHMAACGLQPGELVEWSFLGLLSGGNTDDEGCLQLSMTIPAGTPAGSHPMDISGDQGSYAELEYTVL